MRAFAGRRLLRRNRRVRLVRALRARARPAGRLQRCRRRRAPQARVLRRDAGRPISAPTVPAGTQGSSSRGAVDLV